MKGEWIPGKWAAHMDDRQALIDMLLDHYQNPHHYGEMDDPAVKQEGGNPDCGDVVTIYLKMDGDQIQDISFTGKGCTISQATTSILTDEFKGMRAEEVQNLGFTFISDLIGDEMVKTRPRCATLGLDTVKAALHEYRRKQLQG